jgi:glycosyltransferase involved in cell wall biosynthesis
MNIAIIYPRFTGPYGRERLLLNLTRSLSKIDNKVTIYTHSTKLLIDKSLLKNIKVIEGNTPTFKNHQIATFVDLLLMPLLVSKIRNKYDVIVLIGWQSTFGGYFYKKFINKNQKVFYYCLEPPRIVYDLKQETLNKTSFSKKIILFPLLTLIKKIDFISVKSINNILSISDWTQKQVKSIYNKESLVIYPGVEIERFRKITKIFAKTKLKIPKNKTIYLSVSKLHYRKRLDLAIKVFLEYKEKDSLFYIIGDGPYKEEILKIIKKLGMDNIILLGELSDEEVTLFMKASDYFIFTAQNEPFGMAPLEAYVAGCKVIPHGIKYKPTDWKSVAKQHVKYYKLHS